MKHINSLLAIIILSGCKPRTNPPETSVKGIEFVRDGEELKVKRYWTDLSTLQKSKVLNQLISELKSKLSANPMIGNEQAKGEGISDLSVIEHYTRDINAMDLLIDDAQVMAAELTAQYKDLPAKIFIPNGFCFYIGGYFLDDLLRKVMKKLPTNGNFSLLVPVLPTVYHRVDPATGEVDYENFETKLEWGVNLVAQGGFGGFKSKNKAKRGQLRIGFGFFTGQVERASLSGVIASASFDIGRLIGAMKQASIAGNTLSGFREFAKGGQKKSKAGVGLRVAALFRMHSSIKDFIVPNNFLVIPEFTLNNPPLEVMAGISAGSYQEFSGILKDLIDIPNSLGGEE